MTRVVVCGSLNMDVIAQSTRRPVAGETILGATVSFLPGGKGLNQAVAASRLGAKTAILGAVGGDAFGETLREVLADNGVDASGVRTIGKSTTGVALIQVAEGDNAITGASGANMLFATSMVGREPRRGEIWLAQFETPITTTEAVFRRARAVGARTILNLAPVVRYPSRLMKLVDIAVLNEIELAQATGRRITPKSPDRDIVSACGRLGVPTVVATLGGRGLVIVSPDGVTVLAALPAKVVDTTGAGDCFVGALAARLAAGRDLLDAARYANAAAACSVERLGAAPSMPTAREVAARLARA
ncbi:MAG: ribokinase [Rhodospirillales bacterium]|nr:ribokinase [Rhodospirillales bacterium]